MSRFPYSAEHKFFLNSLQTPLEENMDSCFFLFPDTPTPPSVEPSPPLPTCTIPMPTNTRVSSTPSSNEPANNSEKEK